MTINEKGQIVDSEVIEEIRNCESCTKIALNIVKKMPKWEPAYELDEKKKKLKPIVSKKVVEIEFKRK